MSEVFWTGSLKDTCQLCNEPYGSQMIDGAVHAGGPWANMCVRCHFARTTGDLGVGLGQLYELQPDGRWLLIVGGLQNIEDDVGEMAASINAMYEKEEAAHLNRLHTFVTGGGRSRTFQGLDDIVEIRFKDNPPEIGDGKDG